MSRQQTGKAQPAQLTEHQLDEAQGGLLPAVKIAGKPEEPVANHSAVVFVGGWGSSMYQH